MTDRHVIADLIGERVGGRRARAVRITKRGERKHIYKCNDSHPSLRYNESNIEGFQKRKAVRVMARQLALPVSRGRR